MATQKLPKVKIVETYWHDLSLESSWGALSDGNISFHWKILEEHFLMVLLVFRFTDFSQRSVLDPLRTEVYFCHQNQNAKNIGNFTTLLKPHNIGTHLKCIETSFQVVPLFFKSFHFWVSFWWHFLKIPSVFKESNTVNGRFVYR
jgi:hypothetical protein